jgi:hypothetical protein
MYPIFYLYEEMKYLGWRCSSLVECFLSMHEALGLIQSTIKKL